MRPFLCTDEFRTGAPNNKKIDMEHETEIRSLSAETLATSIVLANLLSRFARIPALRLAIVSCFDQSVDMADDIMSLEASDILASRVFSRGA